MVFIRYLELRVKRRLDSLFPYPDFRVHYFYSSYYAGIRCVPYEKWIPASAAGRAAMIFKKKS